MKTRPGCSARNLQELELLVREVERPAGHRHRVRVHVQDERSQANDGLGGTARAAPEHRDANADPRLGGARVQEVVGERLPREALQVAALDHDHRRDRLVEIADGAEHRVSPPGVVAGVDEEDLGPKRQHLGHRGDRELFGLQVEQQRAEAGKRLVGGDGPRATRAGPWDAPGYPVIGRAGTLDLR